MNKKLEFVLLDILVRIHLIIVFFVFIGLILIFFKPYTIYFAYMYVIIVGIEILFKLNCPLTILEYKMRENLRLSRDKGGFINRLLKNTFNITLPEKLISYILLGYFFYSMYILIRHFNWL